MIRYLLILFCAILIFPSVGKSQKIGIPYRVGNQWGLADTLGKIILTPQFDSIDPPYFYLTNRKSIFYTYKDGLKGVVYQNKEIIKPGFDEITISHNFFINGEIKYGQRIIFNFLGQRLFKDTIERLGVAFWNIGSSVPWTNSLFEFHTIGGRAGLIRYNEKTQQVQQVIISDCDKFYISQITLGNQKKEANVELQKRRMIFHEKPGYEIIYDTLNWLVEIVNGNVLSSHKLSYSPQHKVFTLAPISFSEKKQIKNEQFGTTGWHGDSDRPGLARGGDRREVSDKDSVKFTLRFGTLYQHIHVSAKKNYKRSTPSWDTSFKVKPPINTDIRIVNYGKSDGNWTHFKNDLADVQLSVTNYVIYKQNGFWGIITDNAVVPAEFESIRGIRDRFGKLFIVSKYNSEHQLKYGIIDEKGKELLPISCDSLIFNSDDFLSFFEKYIMIKEGKYYVMGFKFVPIVDQAYDSIIQPANSTFRFNGYLNGKIQYFTVLNYEAANFSPWLSYKDAILDQKYFDGYQVWKLGDSAGKFVGYGDNKGFYYFKD